MTEEKQGAAEWLRGILKEYEASGARSCSAMAKMFGIDCEYETCRWCMTMMLTAIADRIDAERALPEGIEWPRFEDGELVRIGDEVEFEGETWKVRCTILSGECWALNVERGYDLVTGRCDYGERVKRPTPKVLDADGTPIEVGDTVWYIGPDKTADPRKMRTVDGFTSETGKLRVLCGIYEIDPDMLTHKEPDSWRAWGEDLDAAVKSGEVDKVEMMRRAKALAKAGE